MEEGRQKKTLRLWRKEEGRRLECKDQVRLKGKRQALLSSKLYM